MACLIASLLLVSACAADEPRKLFLYLDTSRESKILEAELTRDWSIRPSAELAIWEARRKRVAQRVQIVRLNQIESYKARVTLPAIAWGEFGRATTIDPRWLAGSGTALTCVEIEIHNFDVDLTPWKNQCERITECAEWDHAQELLSWVCRTLPDEWNEFPVHGYHWSSEDIRERFGAYDGAPRFVPPVLPPSPLRRFPWE